MGCMSAVCGRLTGPLCARCRGGGLMRSAKPNTGGCGWVWGDRLTLLAPGRRDGSTTRAAAIKASCSAHHRRCGAGGGEVGWMALPGSTGICTNPVVIKAGGEGRSGVQQHTAAARFHYNHTPHGRLACYITSRSPPPLHGTLPMQVVHTAASYSYSCACACQHHGPAGPESRPLHGPHLSATSD